MRTIGVASPVGWLMLLLSVSPMLSNVIVGVKSATTTVSGLSLVGRGGVFGGILATGGGGSVCFTCYF